MDQKMQAEPGKKLKIAVSINFDWPLKRYHQVFAGIQEYALQNTDWILIWDHFPERVLKGCDSSYYDGIIGRLNNETLEEIERLKIPAVNVWHSNQPNIVPSVLLDYEVAGRMAAVHLIKRGFRNLINIDFLKGFCSTDFYKGFATEASRFNCQVSRNLFSINSVDNRESWHKFHTNFDSWIKEWEYPVGIAASESSTGVKITSKLNEHGISIPDQAAIITAGNDNTFCEGFLPKISSVAQDYYRVGSEGARILQRLIQGEVFTENLLIPPTGIVPRESSDTYAVNDEHVKIALRFIAENCYESIQITDIIDSVDISRRSLEKKFLQEVGHSMLYEVNRLRVNSLKKLLMNSSAKIKDLYKDLGFSSSLHLIRVFKKFTGMTPTDYRNACRNDQNFNLGEL